MVVPEQAPSHFRYPGAVSRPDPPTWTEVFQHLGSLLEWSEEGVELAVVEEGLDLDQEADVWLSVDADPAVAAALSSEKQNFLGLGRNATTTTNNNKDVPPPSVGSTEETARQLFARKNADDLLYMVLVLVNDWVRDVPRVSMAKSKGFLGSLRLAYCMLGNCSKEVLDCVRDPTCKAALDCLQECGLNDQVCSYQCIVSYESPLFESFSQCVLQRHNCMRNFARVPDLPVVEPISQFRGEALTHEQAEDILVGWLGEERHSWKVVTGQNAAYDIFPNQHQVFYRGKRKGRFWYDPVFQARTFDGDLVWRKRHYRVRRGKVPGTFYFSVLDNGVVSDEYWRIADVAEDLSWALLYYAGAASAAGQSYTGAVFVSRDGKWPEARELGRVEAAHAKCGIKMWELFEVENYDCPDAPLDPLE